MTRPWLCSNPTDFPPPNDRILEEYMRRVVFTSMKPPACENVTTWPWGDEEYGDDEDDEVSGTPTDDEINASKKE